MEVSHFDIEGPALLKPRVFVDERGYFLETYRESIFSKLVGDKKFVQDNQSFSKYKNTIRGLHYQKSPNGQGKLIRCVKGAIFDVFVDIRPHSNTFGQWRAVELSEENKMQLWIPDGFLHGFCTLVDDCFVAYRVTQYYMPQFDAAIAFNDPKIGIDWPIEPSKALVSQKDAAAAPFSELLVKK